jgi:periplasmic divalent cation tolerance protein
MVLTTVGADFDAPSLSRALVEARVAACVNIISGVQSIYRWENAIAEDGEQLLLIKTTAARVDELREALFARHPYEVPEFVVLQIDQVAKAYGAWLTASTS